LLPSIIRLQQLQLLPLKPEINFGPGKYAAKEHGKSVYVSRPYTYVPHCTVCTCGSLVFPSFFIRGQLFPPSLYGLIISFGIDAAINYRKPQRGARQQDGKNESG